MKQQTAIELVVDLSNPNADKIISASTINAVISNKQSMTAVEWFFRWLEDNQESTIKEYFEAFEQAKQMEKEQLLRSFSVGNDCGYCFAKTEDTQQYNSGVQYYNETYNEEI
jgi:predicted Zn-ribbon and HTH transcriptional regulator